MLGNDVISKERIADLLRAAEADRRSRPVAEFRAAKRRGHVRVALTSMWSVVTPTRRRAVHPVAGR